MTGHDTEWKMSPYSQRLSKWKTNNLLLFRPLGEWRQTWEYRMFQQRFFASFLLFFPPIICLSSWRAVHLLFLLLFLSFSLSLVYFAKNKFLFCYFCSFHLFLVGRLRLQTRNKKGFKMFFRDLWITTSENLLAQSLSTMSAWSLESRSKRIGIP